MRLGQLARKVNISPSDIEAHLIEAKFPAESGINTRLSDGQVQLILKRFAPQLLVTELNEILESSDEDIQQVSVPVQEIPESPVADSEETSESDEPQSLPDVIKAPKIELQGLKVLGKIDLPEPKKKPEPEVKPEIKSGEKSENKPRYFYKQENNRYNKTERNPIEAQRRREAREAEKRKVAETRKKKELRTQAYFKNLEQNRAAKKSRKEVREVADQRRKKTTPPNSFLGRIWHWLTQAD